MAADLLGWTIRATSSDDDTKLSATTGPQARNPRHAFVAKVSEDGILGIQLGFVGAHRFYLGHKGWAVLQAAVFVHTCSFTFGLVGLWCLTERIMILRKAKMLIRDASAVPTK